MEIGPCFLCVRPGARHRRTNDNRGDNYECDTCGAFWVSLLFDRDHSATLTPSDRWALSAATRQAAQPLELMNSNWRDLVAAHSTVPVGRKLEKLFEAVRAGSSHAGQYVQLDPAQSYPLTDASGADEFTFLADVLVSESLLERRNHGLRLTGKGWAKAEALGAASQAVAFVAMWFGDEMKNPFEKGIKPAIEEDCGFTKAIRVDQEHFGEKIDDQIIANIRRCRFIVADFTGQRGGVYFEAGFAMGLGKPIIWTCREDEIGKVHFDTRQYPHVVWKDPADLRQKLTDHIRARIPGAKLNPL